MTERIEKIKISDLIPFENHPFKTKSGVEQEELTESIMQGGLLTPIIVRLFRAVNTKSSAVIGELKFARNSA